MHLRRPIRHLAPSGEKRSASGRAVSGATGSAVAAAIVLALTVTGCTAVQPGPGPTPSSSTAASSSSTAGPATGAPVAVPTFAPNGSAADNRAFFDSVNTALIASKQTTGETPDGEAFISALRAAGFAVADMQVTPDVTTVGVKADSIQFSVAIKGQCLIGQYGFAEYHSVVAPVLGSGRCLIGETRAIDW